MSREVRAWNGIARLGAGGVMSAVACLLFACAHAERPDAAPALQLEAQPLESGEESARAPKPDPALREVEMFYDAELGVFVVIGFPGHYHDGERYLRQSGSQWEGSSELVDGWAEVRDSDVPPGLRGRKRSPWTPPERRGLPAKHGY